MGCMKSKQTFPFPSISETEKQHESEEGIMAGDSFLPRMLYPAREQVQQEKKALPKANPVILKYAEHLTEEILHDALKQWTCNHIKYCNIPYIENESPEVVGDVVSDAPSGAVGGVGASLNT